MRTEIVKLVDAYTDACNRYFRDLDTKLDGFPKDYPSIIFELNAETHPTFCKAVLNGEAFQNKLAGGAVWKPLISSAIRDVIKYLILKIIVLVSLFSRRGTSVKTQLKQAKNFLVTYLDSRSGQLDQKDFNMEAGSIFDQGAWLKMGVRLPSISWLDYFRSERAGIVCVERHFKFRYLFGFYVSSYKILLKLKRAGQLSSPLGIAFLDDFTSGHATFSWQYSHALRHLIERTEKSDLNIALPMEQQDWMMLSVYHLKKSVGGKIWAIQNGLRPVGNLNLYNFDDAPAYRQSGFDRIYYVPPTWDSFWKGLGHKSEAIGMPKHRFSNASYAVTIDKQSKRALYIGGVSVLKFNQDIELLLALGEDWEICAKIHPTMPSSPLIDKVTSVSDIAEGEFSFIVYSNTAMVFQLQADRERMFFFSYPQELLLNPVCSVDDWHDTTIYMPSADDCVENSRYLASKIVES
ncbi:MAG: hypothetical protein COA42_00425 [Alteromonadaceae bacterium]|nr:MAG: hypothetical protein COA42_00425 [Alteromonadaceae bacterium]